MLHYEEYVSINYNNIAARITSLKRFVNLLGLYGRVEGNIEVIESDSNHLTTNQISEISNNMRTNFYIHKPAHNVWALVLYNVNIDKIESPETIVIGTGLIDNTKLTYNQSYIEIEDYFYEVRKLKYEFLVNTDRDKKINYINIQNLREIVNKFVSDNKMNISQKSSLFFINSNDSILSIDIRKDIKASPNTIRKQMLDDDLFDLKMKIDFQSQKDLEASLNKLLFLTNFLRRKLKNVRIHSLISSINSIDLLISILMSMYSNKLTEDMISRINQETMLVIDNLTYLGSTEEEFKSLVQLSSSSRYENSIYPYKNDTRNIFNKMKPKSEDQMSFELANEISLELFAKPLSHVFSNWKFNNKLNIKQN